MAYPSFEEYTETLQLPLDRVFFDPLLARGQVSKNALGLPFARSGNFALTYEVKVGSDRYAVRCFHKQSNSLEARYAAISRHLSGLRSQYFVDFQFQRTGIRTRTGTFPIVRMGWCAGDTLGEFVSANRYNKAALDLLVDVLRDLRRFLRQQSIAHGDIQPGNIIVGAGGRDVRLIDYDGMFVPEIAALGSAEIGQRNFQHPKRTGAFFDATLDHFSFIVLELALRALREDPDLWDATNSDEDGFVFRATDFADPASSRAFSLTSRIPALERDVKNFASVCRSDFTSIPRPDDFFSGKGIPPVTVVISRQSTTTPRPAYISAFTVVDASDFQACLRHVGDRVELIGRIVEVKEGRTKRGRRPYVFINFAPFPRPMASLKIWSSGLAKFSKKPDQSWIGKWVSVVGLVDPLYRGRYRGVMYENVAVTILDPAQLRILSEEEARYRLGARVRPSTIASMTSAIPSGTSRNGEIIDGMSRSSTARTRRTSRGAQRGHTTIGSSRPIASTSTRNQQVLDRMRATARQSYSGARKPSTPPASASGSRVPWWVWVAATVVVLIALANS